MKIQMLRWHKISKYVFLMSCLYLFDASVLPLSRHAVAIPFATLTFLYLVSIGEITLILSLFAAKSKKVYKYFLFQSR